MSFMCYGEIHIKAIEDRFQLNFNQVFSMEVKKLDEFSRKGFVIVDKDFVRVTDIGRIFLRKIASVFDQYYAG